EPRGERHPRRRPGSDAPERPDVPVPRRLQRHLIGHGAECGEPTFAERAGSASLHAMRIATFALPVLFLSVGCGGRVAGGDVYENAGDEAAETTTKTDRLEILRQRCALPRKSAFESEAPATTTLLEGRWLRCPSDRDPSFPMAYVVSFEA